MTSVPPDIEAHVRAFIAEHLDPDAATLGTEVDLLDQGLLNSLTLVHLVVYLEETFGIEIPPAEFDAGNFRSIATIVAFVQTKTA